MLNWISISIRISSTELTSSDISEIMGIEPSASSKEGELMSPRNPKSQRFESNLWIYEIVNEHANDLKSNFIALNEFVKKKERHLKKLLVNCEMEVFCGVSYNNGQGELFLDTATLKILTSIPIEIIFDLYFEDDSDM